MNTPIYIDSNAWNFLFERSINIDTELPCDEFVIFCTQEVFIELESIPNTGKDGKSKRGLKAYIQKYMDSRVNISADFGFYEASPCFAGFGQGTFQPEESRSYYERPETQKMILNKSVRKETGLGKNEADASLACVSQHSIVLTCDKKHGPLSEAYNSQWKVITLTDILLQNTTLRKLVLSLCTPD